jgi:hypothetical protein
MHIITLKFGRGLVLFSSHLAIFMYFNVNNQNVDLFVRFYFKCNKTLKIVNAVNETVMNRLFYYYISH